MISTSFLLSPSRRHNWLYRTVLLELKYPSLAPKLLLLCWGLNLILFLGRKEKKAGIENWPVLSRNTICFPSPQLAIKLDGFGSRAGTSHPKLKACIPCWSEVKSFDPALRTEELSSVSAPQSQTSTTQGGTEDAVEGCAILWEIPHRQSRGTTVLLVDGAGVNMSSEMKHVFTPECGSWLGLQF